MPRASKIAFIDVRVFNARLGAFEQQNILIQNRCWVGAGYLPDEDSDATIYSLPKALLIPNIVDAIVLTPESIALGITAGYILPPEIRLPCRPFSPTPAVHDFLISAQPSALTHFRPSKVLSWWQGLGLDLSLIIPSISIIPARAFGVDVPKWGLGSMPSFSLFDSSTFECIGTVIKGQPSENLCLP